MNNLHNLSQQDFERQKKQMIEDYISSLPEERQLKVRQEQWKIDNVMRKCKNPLVRAQKMYNLMMESFNELNDELQKWRKE